MTASSRMPTVSLVDVEDVGGPEACLGQPCGSSQSACRQSSRPDSCRTASGHGSGGDGRARSGAGEPGRAALERRRGRARPARRTCRCRAAGVEAAEQIDLEADPAASVLVAIVARSRGAGEVGCHPAVPIALGRAVVVPPAGMAGEPHAYDPTCRPADTLGRNAVARRPSRPGDRPRFDTLTATVPIAVVTFHFDPSAQLFGDLVVRWGTIALVVVIVAALVLAGILARAGGLRADDVAFVAVGIVPGRSSVGGSATSSSTRPTTAPRPSACSTRRSAGWSSASRSSAGSSPGATWRACSARRSGAGCTSRRPGPVRARRRQADDGPDRRRTGRAEPRRLGDAPTSARVRGARSLPALPSVPSQALEGIATLGILAVLTLALMVGAFGRRDGRSVFVRIWPVGGRPGGRVRRPGATRLVAGGLNVGRGSIRCGIADRAASLRLVVLSRDRRRGTVDDDREPARPPGPTPYWPDPEPRPGSDPAHAGRRPDDGEEYRGRSTAEDRVR